MVRVAALGAVLAGAYGSLHDQVSFAISPEYFTKLKFAQFAWADIGLPPRAFASEVGFLASWWVGMIAGWVLARIGFGEACSRRDVARAFAIVLGVAAVCGAIGALLGRAAARTDIAEWDGWRLNLRLTDPPAFVVVAWLHWASYLGAVTGLVVATVDARWRARRARALDVPLPADADRQRVAARELE
jgi:hypothetical protein